MVCSNHREHCETTVNVLTKVYLCVSFQQPLDKYVQKCFQKCIRVYQSLSYPSVWLFWQALLIRFKFLYDTIIRPMSVWNLKTLIVNAFPFVVQRKRVKTNIVHSPHKSSSVLPRRGLEYSYHDNCPVLLLASNSWKAWVGIVLYNGSCQQNINACWLV
jgi:hypothetical protein